MQSTKPKSSAKGFSDACATVKKMNPLPEHNLDPLIPHSKQYKHNVKKIFTHLPKIITACKRKGVAIDSDVNYHDTGKLVHALCTAAKAEVWSKDFEDALVDALPLREHHVSFISHNMFVTMIGALVARALEKGTSGALDLIADRYYVRGITCHDSSKTSTVEAAAYAGIMAVHMERDAASKNLLRNKARFKSTYEQTPSQNPHHGFNMDVVLSMMANFGFKHHYEKNPHHPEHFRGGIMNDMNVVQAIVDGLACIFERQENSSLDVWLDKYTLNRFTAVKNKQLAEGIIKCLRQHISTADYKALLDFKSIVLSFTGESIPWSRVTMTDCCSYTATDVPECNFLQHF